jgi:hypothetical protein
VSDSTVVLVLAPADSEPAQTGATVPRPSPVRGSGGLTRRTIPDLPDQRAQYGNTGGRTEP